jgi:hypothetical protein
MSSAAASQPRRIAFVISIYVRGSAEKRTCHDPPSPSPPPSQAGLARSAGSVPEEAPRPI